MLEYASSIWYPTQVGLMDRIESVQWQFTKHIAVLQELSYSERLTALNLKSRPLEKDVQSINVLCYGMIYLIL